MKRYVKSYVDVRKNTNRLLEMVDEDLISKDAVINAFVTFLSDDDVGEVLRDLGIDDQDDD